MSSIPFSSDTNDTPPSPDMNSHRSPCSLFLDFAGNHHRRWESSSFHLCHCFYHHRNQLKSSLMHSSLSRRFRRGLTCRACSRARGRRLRCSRHGAERAWSWQIGESGEGTKFSGWWRWRTSSEAAGMLGGEEGEALCHGLQVVWLLLLSCVALIHGFSCRTVWLPHSWAFLVSHYIS